MEKKPKIGEDIHQGFGVPAIGIAEVPDDQPLFAEHRLFRVFDADGFPQFVELFDGDWVGVPILMLPDAALDMLDPRPPGP